MAHTGTNPIEPSLIQAEQESQSKPPSYTSLDPALILQKDPRTYTMDERMALWHSLKKKESPQ